MKPHASHTLVRILFSNVHKLQAHMSPSQSACVRCTSEASVFPFSWGLSRPNLSISPLTGFWNFFTGITASSDCSRGGVSSGTATCADVMTTVGGWMNWLIGSLGYSGAVGRCIANLGVLQVRHVVSAGLFARVHRVQVQLGGATVGTRLVGGGSWSFQGAAKQILHSASVSLLSKVQARQRQWTAAVAAVGFWTGWVNRGCCCGTWCGWWWGWGTGAACVW
jgi:hypothetical protein